AALFSAAMFDFYPPRMCFFLFFFNDPAPTEIYTLSLHDALPISVCAAFAWFECRKQRVRGASEISRGLGIRVVGAVPTQAGLERRLVGPGGESDLEGTAAMESIDAIRTRLLHEADTKSTRVVMVTSAGAGEGQTTL